MAVSTQTMTDEQRKSVALEYLKAFDNGGVTSSGGRYSKARMHIVSTLRAVPAASLAIRLTRSGCRSPSGSRPVPLVAMRTRSLMRSW